MNYLTGQEQKVLGLVLGLLLIGWAVKAWRISDASARAPAPAATPR